MVQLHEPNPDNAIQHIALTDDRPAGTLRGWPAHPVHRPNRLDFPELTIVCGHIGYPWTQEMIAVARKHDNAYIDTSAHTPSRFPREFVAFMCSPSGRHKVLFGTNYPMILPAQALDGLDRLGLDDESTNLYLGGNAQRLLGDPA